MPSSYKLLFCPHCAGKAQMEESSPGKLLPFQVGCTRCYCRTPNCKLPEIAATLWNRRVQRKPLLGVISKKPSIRRDR